MLKYLRQIAVITPYAQFRFRYTAQDERNSVTVTFVRRTLKMPVPPAVRTDCHDMHHARSLIRAVLSQPWMLCDVLIRVYLWQQRRGLLVMCASKIHQSTCK